MHQGARDGVVDAKAKVDVSERTAIRSNLVMMKIVVVQIKSKSFLVARSNLLVGLLM